MNAHKFRRLLALLSGVMLLWITTGFHGPAQGTEIPTPGNRTIVLTTIFPPEVSFFSEMSKIYTEVFRRLGYGFKLTSQPGERAMIDADLGIVDGEAGRIKNIDRAKYANLIMVPYPIAKISDGAYATDRSIAVNGWESLTGKPYKVGLVKGIKSVEEKLPLYVDQRNIVTISNLEQCLKMLQAGRIDLFIVSTQVEESALMKSGAFKDVKPAGIVETKELFPWMHQRHRDLVQPLADTLRQMKSEGWY